MGVISAFLLTALLAVAMIAFPATARIAAPASLPAKTALAMAEAAVDRCQSLGYPVVAIVTSSEGLVRIQYQSDDAHAIDVASARRKAATAAMTGHPTSEPAAIAKSFPGCPALLQSLYPDALAVNGGVPILSGARIVGAIGIAGGPGEGIDERCALAGISVASAFGAGS